MIHKFELSPRVMRNALQYVAIVLVAIHLGFEIPPPIQSAPVRQEEPPFMCDDPMLIERTASDIRWSIDSTKLALVSYAVNSERCVKDVTVRVFDTANNNIIFEYSLSDPAYAAAWHPNNSQLAIGNQAGTLEIWDVNTGQLNGSYQIAEGGILGLEWSPDGNHLALGGWDNILRILSPIGQVEVSTDLGTTDPGLRSGIRWLGWSPDGTKLASGGTDGIIRIWNPVNLQQTAALDGHSGTPIVGAWSRNGQYIASGGYDNVVSIWNVAAGQQLFQMLGHSGYISGLGWSPDSSQLASVSEDGTARFWNTTTGGLLQTVRSSIQLVQVDWSSDNRVAYGGRTTFSYDEDFNLVDTGLPIVAPFDPNAPPLIIETPPPTPTPTDTPTPTPTPPFSSPNQILFSTAFTGTSGGIYRINPDGTGLTQMTNANDTYAWWSPDGSKVAFNSTRDGNQEIYVMNADGSNQQNLSNHSGIDQFSVWSPDGSQIAFTSTRDGNYEIYVVNADGSNLTRLTNHNADDFHPNWSPDGSQIAFTSYRNGNADIYVMNADGTNPVQLTTSAANESYPTWGYP